MATFRSWEGPYQHFGPGPYAASLDTVVEGPEIPVVRYEERRRRRNRPSGLQRWAQAVKDRDGECGRCGGLDDLHAHHVRPRKDFPELVLDLDNGVTLCVSCHRADHPDLPDKLFVTSKERSMRDFAGFHDGDA